MKKPLVKRIFARTDETDFVGRESHVERLLALAKSGSTGLVLLATPSSGISELLRHVYDRLFLDKGETIPFYFEIRKSDRTAQNASIRFLFEFLRQTVAFRRRDPRIIDAAPEISQIADLAVPEDGYWIDRLVETYSTYRQNGDDSGLTRICLSAPLRAASNGARSIVLIDDLHLVDSLEGGDAFLDEIREIVGRTDIPFVLAGQRRSMYARTSFETMPLDVFSFAEAGKFSEHLAARIGVEINDQTRDLIAVQLGGNAGHMASLLASAAANGIGLNSFESVEQVYTGEIFGGRIGRYLDSVLEECIPDAVLRAKVLWILTENVAARNGRVPISYWRRHAGLASSKLDLILNTLHSREVRNVGSGWVEIDDSSLVLCDYIAARKRLEIDNEPRALAVGETLTENVKRAPQLMTRSYRRTSSIGLRELLTAFDGRRISTALLEYKRFKEEFKGVDDDHIRRSLKLDESVVTLPQVVYTANTAAFYPQLNELCEPERSSIGIGFRDTARKEETAWIAVQIDSKLEAKREVAEFWLDRLEMVAIHSDLTDYRLWLIAPEGFDDEALAVLHERGAYASSRKQVDLLATILDAHISSDLVNSADEYEIVVPMGEDTEMIAAHTIEEIAKRHNFPAKAINQIKTALVEACINATEHSLSPDRRIHQKFSVEADKITITVSNRGVRLADREVNPDTKDEGRRGWGLKLMRGLMDEVRIDRTDDGTQITMVKYLPKTAGAVAA